MNTKEIQSKTTKRYKSLSVKTLGIQGYGEDNLYPENLRNIVAASATGAECVDRYADFLEGEGFEDLAFAETIVNFKNQTADDIHAKICRDIALYNGFALHIDYNIYGEMSAIEHIPFECCRLCEADDFGYINKIAVHPDWTGEKQVRGKTIKVNRESVDYIFSYNSNPQVVLEQIDAVGGISNYSGQVLWVSLNGENTYPTPIADRVITEMSTDEGLANVTYRNVRCNFLPSGIIVTKRGTIAGVMQEGIARDEDEAANILNERSEEFSDALAKMQGDTKSNKIIEVEIETDEEKPEFIPVKVENYDKEFTNSEQRVVERIYSAFNQECFYMIRIGKVGFGGQVIQDAFSLYNSSVSKTQRQIERTFKMLFSNWRGQIFTNFAVQPKIYIATENTNGTSANI